MLMGARVLHTARQVLRHSRLAAAEASKCLFREGPLRRVAQYIQVRTPRWELKHIGDMSTPMKTACKARCSIYCAASLVLAAGQCKAAR